MTYKRILVVDDDADDQEIFLSALASVSREVECSTASSGIEALKNLAGGTTTTDLIFLDLNMPIMNGLQFLQEIKKQDTLSHIPVIILSTTSHWRTKEQAKELGAIDFITKPSRYNELVEILQRVIN